MAWCPYKVSSVLVKKIWGGRPTGKWTDRHTDIIYNMLKSKFCNTDSNKLCWWHASSYEKLWKNYLLLLLLLRPCPPPHPPTLRGLGALQTVSCYHKSNWSFHLPLCTPMSIFPLAAYVHVNSGCLSSWNLSTRYHQFSLTFLWRQLPLYLPFAVYFLFLDSDTSLLELLPADI